MESQIVTSLSVTEVQEILSDRVYLLVSPEDAEKPYCRFSEVVGYFNQNLSGQKTQTKTRFQFDFFGTNFSELKNARNAVLRALEASFQTSGAQSRTGPSSDQENFHLILDLSLWH